MASAALVVNKAEQALQLRAESQSLGKEVSELQLRLETAERARESLQEKRRRLAEAGKPGGVELHAAIADAEAQLEVLRGRLTRKRRALDAARGEVDSLDWEIEREARLAARKARIEDLESQGIAVCSRIAEKIRALIEEDLPAFDAVRDLLAQEFIHRDGVFNAADNDVEANAARALIHKLERHWMDGSFLATERTLLRGGWQVRGDVVLEIKNLRPPKK